jgi:sarcosine oxidase subunit beta
MSLKVYDAIVIGAGSVGVPTALALAEKNLSVLVLDSHASVGQGSNKAAIGGIRATHSDPAKIHLGMRSIEIFSSWKEKYHDDIEWKQSGYAFVAYRQKEAESIKSLVEKQKTYGLNVKWCTPEEMLEIAPGLKPDGLLGGSFSPGDGSASPLLSIHAFFRRAKSLGAEFQFHQKVEEIITENGIAKGVKTNTDTFHAPIIINAAGAHAKAIGELCGMHLPVLPDSHESAITEPVQPLFDPMIVDIQPTEHSSNYYFYQHKTGQIVFCITPKPNIWGFDTNETSSFLPMVSKRILSIMPGLAKLRVRRTWRGLYPMTPDGFPIVGFSNEIKGIIAACGMCGQGFMLGPGLGELVSRMVTEELTEKDHQVLNLLRPDRNFDEIEELQ